MPTDCRHLPHRTRQCALVVATTALVVLLAGCGAAAAGRTRGGSDPNWTVAGQLQAWDGEVWIVDATPLVVPAGLGVDGQRVLGANVQASGVLDDRGRRVAQRVAISPGSLPNSTLPAARVTGTIDGIAGETWSIAGQAVRVPAGTPVVAAVGDAAALRAAGNRADARGYTLPSGTLLAVSVTLQPAPPTVSGSSPATAPAATATPNAASPSTTTPTAIPAPAPPSATEPAPTTAPSATQPQPTATVVPSAAPNAPSTAPSTATQPGADTQQPTGTQPSSNTQPPSSTEPPSSTQPPADDGGGGGGGDDGGDDGGGGGGGGDDQGGGQGHGQDQPKPEKPEKPKKPKHDIGADAEHADGGSRTP